MALLFKFSETCMFKDKDKEKINFQLDKKIEDQCDLDQFKIEIDFSDDIEPKELNCSEIKQGKIIWENIAKLSIDMYTDYEYYRKFSFKNELTDNFYKKRLIKLGFVCNNDVWINERKPLKEDVQKNIFMFHLYQSLTDNMERNPLVHQNNDNEQRQLHVEIHEPENQVSSLVQQQEQMQIPVQNPDHSSSMINEATNVIIEDSAIILCRFCNNENNAADKVCAVCVGELYRQVPLDNRSTLTDNDRSNVSNQIRCTDGGDVSHVSSSVRNVESCDRLSDGSSIDRGGDGRRNVGNVTLGDGRDKYASTNAVISPQRNEVRTVDVSVISRAENMWRCQLCTCDNDMRLDVCGACLNNRYPPSDTHKVKETNDGGNKAKKQSQNIRKYITNAALESSDNIGSSDTKMELRSLRSNIGDAAGAIDSDSECTSAILTETWRCIHCKCDNLYDKYICDKCHRRAPFFRKWVCERCSFFNDELSAQCEACDAKNTHLGTCTKCRRNKVNVDVGRECASCTMVTETTTEGWINATYRKCPKCHNKINANDVCKRCIGNKFYCMNRHCGTINDNHLKYCRLCGLKNGSNVTDYNLVEVALGRKEMKMWQCTFCGLFNGLCKVNKCTKCNNMRRIPAYKKCCWCNWVNEDNTNKCDKCFQTLPKRT